MSAAKQRFESHATPAAKYCCLINALALLLAMTASDTRKDKPTRNRAEKMLESMTPESIVIAGLTADYMAEMLDFVRHFDRANVDPATIIPERDAFVRRMRALFLEGFAALEADPNAEDQTYLQIVLAQVEHAPAFHYNDKRHLLWKTDCRKLVKDIVSRIATIVEALIERVEAELCSDDMVCKFNVFNLNEWLLPSMSEAKVHQMRAHVRALCRAIGQDASLGLAGFEALLPVAIRLFRGKCRAAEVKPEDRASFRRAIDHREIWGQLLQDVRPEFRVVHLLIRLYWAVPVGTPDVERGLGALTALLKTHHGSVPSTIWSVLEGYLDGPQSEEELFLKTVNHGTVCLSPTAFARELQHMFIQLHGRRFLNMNKVRPKRTRTGTFEHVRRKRRKAATGMVKEAEGGGAIDRACIGGLKRSQLRREELVAVTPTKRMKDFHKRTRDIMAGRKSEARRRKYNLTWCTKPSVRRVNKPEDAQLEPSRRVSVVVVAGAGLVESTPRVRVFPTLFSSVFMADVVIVENLKQFEQCATWDHLIYMLYVVALGKVLIQRSSWQGRLPEQSANALKFTAQVRVTKRILVIGQHILKHVNATTALRACAGSPDSKWSVVEAKPAPTPPNTVVHEMNSLEQMRKFVFSVRRICRRKGVNGTFQR